MALNMTIRFGLTSKESVLLDKIEISVLAKLIFNRSLYNQYSLTTYEDLANRALFVNTVSKLHKQTIDAAIATLEDEGLVKVIGRYKDVIEYQLLEYEETGLEFDIDVDSYRMLLNKLDNVIDLIAYFYISHSVENEFSMSLQTLADFIGCSKPSASRAVKTLEEKKIISTYKDTVHEGTKHTITKYKIRGLLERVK